VDVPSAKEKESENKSLLSGDEKNLKVNVFLPVYRFRGASDDSRFSQRDSI
jgi:hypothetical protein